MDIPAGAVPHRDSLNRHLPAPLQEKSSWGGRPYYLGLMPPVSLTVSRVPVYGSLPIDNSAFHVHAVYDAGKHGKRIALPCAQIVFALLVIALDHSLEHRKTGPVRIRGQHRPSASSMFTHPLKTGDNAVGPAGIRTRLFSGQAIMAAWINRVSS